MNNFTFFSRENAVRTSKMQNSTANLSSKNSLKGLVFLASMVFLLGQGYGQVLQMPEGAKRADSVSLFPTRALVNNTVYNLSNEDFVSIENILVYQVGTNPINLSVTFAGYEHISFLTTQWSYCQRKVGDQLWSYYDEYITKMSSTHTIKGYPVEEAAIFVTVTTPYNGKKRKFKFSFLVEPFFYAPTKTNLQVYPNPTSDLLNIQMDKSSLDKSTPQISKIKLYDQAGSLLENYTCETETSQLNVSKYKAGRYILQIDNNGVIETRHIQIQK